MRVRVQQGKFFLSFVITVPDLYPADPPTVRVVGSNFGDRLVRSHVRRCEDIIARCVAGVEAGRAMVLASRSKQGAGACVRVCVCTCVHAYVSVCVCTCINLHH